MKEKKTENQGNANSQIKAENLQGFVFCPRCGHTVTGDMVNAFCHECGYRFCPSCSD